MITRPQLLILPLPGMLYYNCVHHINKKIICSFLAFVALNAVNRNFELNRSDSGSSLVNSDPGFSQLIA